VPLALRASLLFNKERCVRRTRRRRGRTENTPRWEEWNAEDAAEPLAGG